MARLSTLPNIGKEIERQLNEVGIHNLEALQEKGSKEAWLMIQKIDSSACINRLYGLEGAIRGIKKTYLSDEVKQDLKNFYNTHKIIGK